jgi:hypothetical protein
MLYCPEGGQEFEPSQELFRVRRDALLTAAGEPRLYDYRLHLTMSGLSAVSKASRLTFRRCGASRSKPGRLAYVREASRLTFPGSNLELSSSIPSASGQQIAPPRLLA